MDRSDPRYNDLRVRVEEALARHGDQLDELSDRIMEGVAAQLGFNTTPEMFLCLRNALFYYGAMEYLIDLLAAVEEGHDKKRDGGKGLYEG